MNGWNYVAVLPSIFRIRGISGRKAESVWDNRMIESRLAVAQQLTEILGIMEIWQRAL